MPFFQAQVASLFRSALQGTLRSAASRATLTTRKGKMKSFFSTILIDAPASRVWGILTDLASWPTWNTTVDNVDGSAALGNTITVYAKASPGRAFPLKVSEFTPPNRMVWRGGMPLGLFIGTRTYVLAQQRDGKLKFEMTEEFRGLMAPLITRSIPDLQPAFDEFAKCLKIAAERPQSEGGDK